MALSDRLLNAWYNGHPALKLLRPLECLYRRVVTGKRQRFLAGEGAIYQPPVPLIVVGNITVGGTGKTPLILWLVEHCQRLGLRVGVVSRGYGAKPAQLPWRVSAEDCAAVAGDEPLLIVQRCGVPLMIDPDRGRAVQALLAAEPLDLILSDDGLQHYRLARDLDWYSSMPPAAWATAAACLPGRCASRRSVCRASTRCSTTAQLMTVTRGSPFISSPRCWSTCAVASAVRWSISPPARRCMRWRASAIPSVSSTPLKRYTGGLFPMHLPITLNTVRRP